MSPFLAFLLLAPLVASHIGGDRYLEQFEKQRTDDKDAQEKEDDGSHEVPPHKAAMGSPYTGYLDQRQ